MCVLTCQAIPSVAWTAFVWLGKTSTLFASLPAISSANLLPRISKSEEQPISSSFDATWLLHTRATRMTVTRIEESSPQVAIDPSLRSGRPCDGSEMVLGVQSDLKQTCSVDVFRQHKERHELYPTPLVSVSDPVSGRRQPSEKEISGCHDILPCPLLSMLWVPSRASKNRHMFLLLLCFLAPFFCCTEDTARGVAGALPYSVHHCLLGLHHFSEASRAEAVVAFVRDCCRPQSTSRPGFHEPPRLS